MLTSFMTRSRPAVPTPEASKEQRDTDDDLSEDDSIVEIPRPASITSAKGTTRTSGHVSIRPYLATYDQEADRKQPKSTEEQDFWGVVTAGEDQVSLEKRASQIAGRGGVMTRDEVEMREVEAAVVL